MCDCNKHKSTLSNKSAGDCQHKVGVSKKGSSVRNYEVDISNKEASEWNYKVGASNKVGSRFACVTLKCCVLIRLQYCSGFALADWWLL